MIWFADFKSEDKLLGTGFLLFLSLGFYLIGRNFTRMKVTVNEATLTLYDKKTKVIPLEQISEVKFVTVTRNFTGEGFRQYRFLKFYDTAGEFLGEIDYQMLLGRKKTQKEFFRILEEHHPHIQWDEKCSTMAQGEYFPLEKGVYIAINATLIGFNLLMVNVFFSNL